MGRFKCIINYPLANVEKQNIHKSVTAYHEFWVHHLADLKFYKTCFAPPLAFCIYIKRMSTQIEIWENNPGPDSFDKSIIFGWVLVIVLSFLWCDISLPFRKC